MAPSLLLGPAPESTGALQGDEPVTTETPAYGRYAEARQILSAVEDILASDDEILRIVSEERVRGQGAGMRLVSRFSDRSAIAGAIAAAPSLLPGWGLAGVAATAIAEMVYVLKTEVEMCLALAAHHGVDIRATEGRQLAFLLAAAATYEVSAPPGTPREIRVGWEAIWNYSGREVSKLLLGVTAALLAVRASTAVGRALLRGIPLLGVGIGAGVNKVLTRRVGQHAIAALKLRTGRSRKAG
jgi:hypothetical protein